MNHTGQQGKECIQSAARAGCARGDISSSHMAEYQDAVTLLPTSTPRIAVPCLVIIAVGFGIVFLLFYLGMQAGK